jgi:hypothetical protein
MKKCVMLLMVLSAMSFGLVVQNPNFDDDARNPGQWDGPKTGWAGNAGFEYLTGDLSPTAQSGTNVASFNQGDWLCSNPITDGLGNTVLVEANKSYDISVWVGRRNGDCGSNAGILKAWLSCPGLETGAGIKLDYKLFDLDGNINQGEWKQVTFTLNTGAADGFIGQNLLIGFDNVGNRANWWEGWKGQVQLDSVVLTPEPATMLMLGLGGLLLRKRS